MAELERRLGGGAGVDAGVQAVDSGSGRGQAPDHDKAHSGHAMIRSLTPSPQSGPADEPGWPDDSAEAAFLADRREADAPVAPAEPGPAAAPDGDPLPPLDGLVQRVPENVRAALDDLFRAKFTGVRRLPPELLK